MSQHANEHMLLLLHALSAEPVDSHDLDTAIEQCSQLLTRMIVHREAPCMVSDNDSENAYFRVLS